MSKTWRFLMVSIGLLVMLLMVPAMAGASTFSMCGSWSVVPTSNPSSNGDYLRAVAAISTHNVWAVGNYFTGKNKGSMIDQTLIEHFNGTSWSTVPSPNPGTGSNGNYLRAVAAISADDIYAVGSASGIGASIEHYDGKSWSAVSNPGLGVLQGIAAI